MPYDSLYPATSLSGLAFHVAVSVAASDIDAVRINKAGTSTHNLIKRTLTPGGEPFETVDRIEHLGRLLLDHSSVSAGPFVAHVGGRSNLEATITSRRGRH
jgi:hypothetical protein